MLARVLPLVVSLSLLAALGGAAAQPSAPRQVVLESQAASLKVDLKGGTLSDFRLPSDSVNPLQGLGHFLCLDRWGPPSEAEAKNGIPFHGEASKVDWKVTRAEREDLYALIAEMQAQLPLAGLEVHRTVRLSKDSPVVAVRETVTNRNPLGRIYNMVQHPTVGGPFLDRETRVDASAGRGFMQSSPLPNPEKPEVRWPHALHQGKRVDLRHLTDDPNPNVVSFQVRDELGWTTATSPTRRLLIGYLWRRSQYPWFNAWRHVENGRPALRGLEFGTTGLHQPFPVLVRKGRIFDLPLFTHLDTAESVTRSYFMFLARTPEGFRGVKSVQLLQSDIVVEEDGKERRKLRLSWADRLYPPF